jgi:hypothetical protein
MHGHALYETAKNILALIGAGSVLCTIALLTYAAISGFRKD